MNKSKTSGTNFLHCFSVKTAIKTTNITEIIPPLPGVNIFPNNVIFDKTGDDTYHRHS